MIRTPEEEERLAASLTRAARREQERADAIREIWLTRGEFTAMDAVEKALKVYGITIPVINSTEDDRPGPSTDDREEAYERYSEELGEAYLKLMGKEEEETDV